MRLVLALILLAEATFSQSPSHELAVLVDNDYPFMTDQYYTAGMVITYRSLIDSKIRIPHNYDSSKTIFSIQAGIKIFTPKNVDTKDIRYMDRPYCGWNFVTADLLNFRKRNSGNHFALQIGYVGRENRMSAGLSWIRLAKETPYVSPHNYANARVAYRF